MNKLKRPSYLLTREPNNRLDSTMHLRTDTLPSKLDGKSKKKKERLKSSEPGIPDPEDTDDPLPSPPPYEPGTNIGGVYERVSTVDMDLKYNVVFTNTPDDKLEQKVNTYVSIGRSNSFNPKKRERSVVKKTRDVQPEVVTGEGEEEGEGEGGGYKPPTDSSIKCIETGIVPMETEDISERMRDIVGYPEPRIKQKRTSSKSSKTNKNHHSNNKNNTHHHSNNALMGTHELVKITPPIRKKDLNKLPRNSEHRSKPPSVSGASVVSSNDSEAASNVGTDSGYEDVNSESSPTARRHQLRDVDVDVNLNSRGTSPVPPTRRNYIDVDVVPMPCSRLLQQRCESINERRNSEKPLNVGDSKVDGLGGVEGSVYTQVVIEPLRPT